MEFNTLTTTLTTFVGVFQGAHARLSPVVNGLLAALAGIDIVLIGFWWALGGGERLTEVIKKILFLGFWLWFTSSFQANAKIFVDSLIDAGLMAAGSSGGHGLLLDPSRIAGYGLNATEALAKALEKVSITDIGDALVFGISYLIIMAAFLVMAIQAFIAVLEYYLIAAIAGVLVPWALLPQTKFLAEKAIGAVVSAGIKLMVLAFIIAVADPVLSSIRFSGEEIKLNELWSVLLVSSAIAYLAWQAPSLAAGLLAGSPSLGASGIAQNVTASVMLAAGVVGGVVAATRAAAGVAAAAAGRVGRAGGLTSHSEANSGGESAGSGSGPPATGGPVGPPPGAGGPGRPGPAQGALSAGASPGRAGSAAPAAVASNVAKELATGFQATKSDPGRRMSLDAPPPAPAPANASASPPAWAASARADLAASAPGTAKPRSATRSVHREGGRVKG